jgi:4-amino-4-deoxy-L-arabinose transferase-like glycosyltransferase
MSTYRLDTRLLTAVLGLLAFLVILFTTRQGIGTSPDSVAYISTARTFWSGQAEVNSTALIFRPPLYPVLLATVSLVGIDALVVARWLNVLLYTANVLLVGFISWRLRPRSPWLVVSGMLLMLAAVPILEIHAYAWSEPTFILFGFTGLYSLSHYLDGKRFRWLFIAAIWVGLATLTRYAGLAFIITGGIALLVLSKQKWVKRLGTAVLFAVIAVVPLLLWLVGNRGSGSSVGGRSFAFHPAGKEHFWQAIFTVSDWLQLPLNTPGVVRVGLLFVVGGTAVCLLLISFLSTRRQSSPGIMPTFYKLLLIFLPVYFLFLLFSISYLDAATPLDNRILSPVYVASLFLTLFILDELFYQARRWRMVQIGLAVLLIAFLTVSLLRNGRWAWMASSQGLGFSSVAWQQAEIIAQIKALPTNTLIFSNSPDAIYLLANRPAQRLPRKVEATTQQVNIHYTADLQAMNERLAHDNGVIVYFSRFGHNTAVPSAQELAETLSLQLLVETAEGAIYITSTDG